MSWRTSVSGRTDWPGTRRPYPEGTQAPRRQSRGALYQRSTRTTVSRSPTIAGAQSWRAPAMTAETSVPRSRRALLTAALGGFAGALAASLGRTARVEAAQGDNLKLGQVNDSGTDQTVLTSAALGAAFTLKTTNTATNATGIFGWTSQTGGNATRGVYGKADGPNSYGVFGRQSGAGGDGAAVYAEGNNNIGLHATSIESTGV